MDKGRRRFGTVAGMGNVLAEVDEALYQRLRERSHALKRPLHDVVLDALRRAVDDPLTPPQRLRADALRAKLPLDDEYGDPVEDLASLERLLAPLAGAGALAAELVDDDRGDWS